MPPREQFPHNVSTRLSDDEYDIVKSLAFLRRSTISCVIREALTDAINNDLAKEMKTLSHRKFLTDDTVKPRKRRRTA